ncbi:MAG TPA: phosphatase PAP2 family protein [Kofleriaceae bacterium]
MSTELHRRDREGVPRAFLWIAIAAGLLTVVNVLVLDRPFGLLMAQYEPSPIWDRGIDALELGIGLNTFPWFSCIVLATTMMIAAALPKTRVTVPALAFITATHLVGQLLTGHIKDWTGRMRPLQWIKAGMPETSWAWVKAYSFPSGHVSIFASLIIPLVAVNPRRLWPLLVIPLYACCARLAVDAHWLSDVTGSIALVCGLTWVLGALIRPRQAAPSRR